MFYYSQNLLFAVFFPFSALIVRSGICQKKNVLGIVLFIVWKDLTFPESSLSFPTITFWRVVFPQPNTTWIVNIKKYLAYTEQYNENSAQLLRDTN